MFGQTGAPTLQQPPRVCQKSMRSELPITKNKENISEKIVESMHIRMQKFLMCKREKISSFLQCVRFIFEIATTLPIFSHTN